LVRKFVLRLAPILADSRASLPGRFALTPFSALAPAGADPLDELVLRLAVLSGVFVRLLLARAELSAALRGVFSCTLAALPRLCVLVPLAAPPALDSDFFAAWLRLLVLTLAFWAADLLALARLAVDPLRVFFRALIV